MIAKSQYFRCTHSSVIIMPAALSVRLQIYIPFQNTSALGYKATPTTVLQWINLISLQARNRSLCRNLTRSLIQRKIGSLPFKLKLHVLCITGGPSIHLTSGSNYSHINQLLPTSEHYILLYCDNVHRLFDLTFLLLPVAHTVVFLEMYF